MRIAIIDDEEDARFLLRRALEQAFNAQIEFISEAASVADGQRLLAEQPIDLLFLDLQLPDGTGFHILQAFPQANFATIIVTAFDQYALRAFNFFALAYLVKPFKQADLEAAVDRFLLQQQNRQIPNDYINVLAESLQAGQLKKVVITSLDGFKVIKINDIIFLKSDSNYTEFFLRDNRHIVCSKTLKEYDLLLSSVGFFRPHRSYLINMQEVESYSKVDGGTITMSNGKQIPIGRRRLTEFRAQFLG